MRFRKWIAAAVVIPSLTLTLAAMAAAPERGAGPTPPRVSFLDGEVSFWRPGAEDWAPAKVNTPLAPGDSLYTGEKANVEIQLAPRALVRGGAGTEIVLESLQHDFVQLKLTVGHAALDLRERALGRTVEVDTPQGAFTIDRPGYYRFDVDENRTTFVTRRDGRASVIPAGGGETDVDPDRQVVLEGNEEHAEVTTGAAPEPDDWDHWNIERTDSLGEPQSARYLPQGVSGGDELDRYGSWRNEPQYGPVWAPAAVPPDWAPYTTGHWVWDPYYGWTWIDDAPWGWAPFHYGRWAFVGGGWVWAPGPVVVAPVYSPALVAFFGPPGVSVSVGIGFPFVSWVALGFGEPIIPWWGPVGFIGTCWWGGWGGPHVVNNVVIQHNTFVNVHNVNVYKNASVNNAVVAVQRDRFGRHDGQHVRISPVDARHLRPVHGNLDVHPSPQSLVPAAGHGRRPPDAVRARPVVATRPPQDPSPHLRASGLNAPPAHVPPPRLVEPARAPHGAPRGGEPALTHERTAPPPPPHAAAHGPGGPGAVPEPVPPHAEHPGRVTGSEHAAGGGPHGAGEVPRGTAPPRPAAPGHGPYAASPAPPRVPHATPPHLPPPSTRPAPAPGYPRSAPVPTHPAPGAGHPSQPHPVSPTTWLPPRHGFGPAALPTHVRQRHAGGGRRWG